MISAVTELVDPLLDDAPTKAETPASLAPDMVSARLAVDASGPSVAASTSSTIAVTTAQETMRLQEIGRTRTFARLAFFLALVVGVALVFVGGDRTAKVVMWATLVPVVATTAWLYWILRDEGAYTVATATESSRSRIVDSAASITRSLTPARSVFPMARARRSAGAHRGHAPEPVRHWPAVWLAGRPRTDSTRPNSSDAKATSAGPCILGLTM